MGIGKVVLFVATCVAIFASSLTAARATTVNYMISGALGSDTLAGAGVATVLFGGAQVTGVTFTLSGSDAAYAQYVGSYTSLSSADQTFLWAYNPAPNANWTTAGSYPSVTLIDPLGAFFKPGASDIFNVGGSYDYTIALGTSNGSGGSVSWTPYSAKVSVSAVPIPGALLLFGSGLTGLAGIGRARRRRG